MHIALEDPPGTDQTLPTEIMAAPAVEDKDSRTYPWHEKGNVYGIQHALQNYDICLPRPLKQSRKEDSVWVMYVHSL
jgi:hypothetical protein